MTIESRLAEIRARVEAATEGPWENDGGGQIGQHWSRPEPWLPVISTDVACISYCYGGSASGVENEADAEFIAASRTDLPALLSAVEAVMALHQPMTPEQARRPSGSGRCFHCRDPYPCRTITALTAALDGSVATRKDQAHD